MISKFSQKIINNELPNELDWNEHLLDAHKQSPSMTPKAFAKYFTDEGLNSYDILAKTLPQQIKLQNSKNITIVDLACGDGFLIHSIFKYTNNNINNKNNNLKIFGFDMSDSELNVAINNIKDPRVHFQNSKANSLPLANQSIDYILCHMAFMLMLPIEPVVAEISRILKPTGSFSAVIGRYDLKTIYTDIIKQVYTPILSKYPKLREFKSGDPRVATLSGLQSLFTKELGFNKVEQLTPIDLNIITDAEGVWNLSKDMYDFWILSHLEKEDLKTNLINVCKKYEDKNKIIKFIFPMNLITIQKTS